MSGPGVHIHSLSAARKAYLVPEWSSRSSSFAIRYPPPGRRIRTPSGPSSLAIRRREGVFGPRLVQPFNPTRYPPPGRRIPEPEGSRRLSSLAIHRWEGVSGPRVVQPFIFELVHHSISILIYLYNKLKHAATCLISATQPTPVEQLTFSPFLFSLWLSLSSAPPT